MPKAVLRCEKIKSRDGLKSRLSHNQRKGPQPRWVAPSGKHVTHSLKGRKPVKIYNEIIKGLDKKPRKDSVLALELVLSASPEYFRDNPDIWGEYDLDKSKAWADASAAWVAEYFGRENIVSVSWHLDEATPHAHVVIAPVDAEGGKKRLNAKKWTGGPSAMRKMQDSYAQSVAELGIERGTSKQISHATHLHHREWYRKQHQLEQQLAAVRQHNIELVRYNHQLIDDLASAKHEISVLQSAQSEEQDSNFNP